MANSLVDLAAEKEKPSTSHNYSISAAQVIDNVDLTCLGRVQVRLPWLPGVEPWARVAVPMAGSGRGTFFIPQIGDEVLVAFHHGDVREPFVIGSLWNGQDRPPALAPTDAVTRSIIHTPLGHELEFNDQTQAITITSITGQKITVDPDKVEVTTTGGSATLTLDTSGNLTIQAQLSLTLKAPNISIQGETIDIKSNVSANINGGSACNIQASLVKIN